MFVKIVFVTGLFALTSLAQATSTATASDASACPVKIVKIEPTGNDSFSDGLLSGGKVHDKEDVQS